MKEFLTLSPKINFFRLEKGKLSAKNVSSSSLNNYEIVPISKNMFVHPNPEMICLIIETDIINNRSKEEKQEYDEKINKLINEK